MRKIYYFFITFFALFLFLEWQFKPSHDFFNKSKSSSDTTNLADSSINNIVYDNYVMGDINSISDIFEEDFDSKGLSHEDIVKLNDNSQDFFDKKDIEEDELFHTKADTITWKLLGIIRYVKKPHPDFEEGVMYPVINTTLKAKQGKTVVIKGFIVPVDTKTYALSKNVFAACFFCGQAGPETITGIKFKGATPKLKTDQYVTLKGTFRYNDDDVDDWIYHIENAVIVDTK